MSERLAGAVQPAPLALPELCGAHWWESVSEDAGKLLLLLGGGGFSTLRFLSVIWNSHVY
jgi:hypothetical protein